MTAAGDGGHATGRRVTLLLDHAENRRLLAEWIRADSPHVPVVPESTPPDSGGDLCVVDAPSLRRCREWIERWKAEAAPTFAPVLLVHSPAARKSSGLWDVIDEAITTPIRPAVFERRLNNLLERRALSVEQTAELERTEGRYRGVFEATNDAMFVVDPDDDVVEECNPRACDLLGYTRAELQSLSFAEDVHAGDGARYREFVEAVLSTDDDLTRELTCRRSDGSDLVAEVSASVLREASETRLLCSVRDITERRERAERLERQRDELDELNRLNWTVRKTTQAVARASSRDELERDVCTRLVSTGHYLLAWIGTADEDSTELVPQTAVGAGAEYLDRVTITTDETATGKGPAGAAYRTREVSVVQDVREAAGFEPWRDAAERFDFRGAVGIPLQHDGELHGVLGIYADVPNIFDATERAVLAELGETIGYAIDALQTQERAQLFEQAVEYAGNAIYITDSEGTIRHANAAFEAQTGYRREEVIGSEANLSRSDVTEEGDADSPWEVVGAGDVWQDQVVSRRKGGRLTYLDRTIAPITDGGDITHFVAVTTDITTRRRRRQQLQALYRVLRHNLRNELNVIGGYASLVDEEVESETVRDATERIEAATDELLTMSEQARRIEQTFSESAQDAPATDSLSTLLGRQLEAVRQASPNARVDASIPAVDAAVDAELETALSELLTNAVKHNDRRAPRVELVAEVTTDADGVEWADITVRDDGPGIPENERQVLRAGEETPLVHGNGLGLWLVNWVVNELGGEIAIGDNDPRGSVVTVRLPLG